MTRLAGALMGVALGVGSAASAHPHVFVDGGVDFILSGQGRLGALAVTWLYDDFDTLYELSSRGIEPGADGSLSPEDREALRADLSNWPDDFDGSAHLVIEGQPVEMDWPSDLAVDLVDGRLQLRFQRVLAEPVSLTGKAVEVGFYESTYFFAFKITNPPEITGDTGCTATVIPFSPGAQSEETRRTLALLSREETPAIANVGQLFADRISLTCD